MSLAGPEALRALDEALRDIRREEDEIMRKLGRSLERVAKIRDSESELLRQLARGRLGPEIETELAGQVARSAVAARETVRQRATEMSRHTERLRQLEKRSAELTGARGAALAEIDRRQAALRGLSPRIAAAIARETAYELQQQEAARLKGVAETAQAKARQADIDREQKGRPYRADPLFSYLQRRDYGGPNYKATGITARLDSWVAGLTGFTTAREHYRMLNELPAGLHVHAEQQAQRARAAAEAADDFERLAIDTAGGGEMRIALLLAQTRIAAIDAEIITIQDERDATTAAQTLLTQAEDPTFDRALMALSRALGGNDVGSLITNLRLAATGPEDPLIVQLDDARLRVGEERIEIHDQHLRLRTLAARRRELEDIEFEFNALKFDDPRSQFRDHDLVQGRLDNFLTGAISAETYWTLWRSGQSWSTGTSEWGGGVGLPRHGRQLADGSVQGHPETFTRPRATPVRAGV